MASTTSAQSSRKPYPANIPPSVVTLPQTTQLEALYTIIRDKDTSRGDFIFYTDRIIRLLVEEGLNHLPVVPRTVETPTVCRTFFSYLSSVCTNARGMAEANSHILRVLRHVLYPVI